jgi:hypothetical protein
MILLAYRHGPASERIDQLTMAAARLEGGRFEVLRLKGSGDGVHPLIAANSPLEGNGLNHRFRGKRQKAGAAQLMRARSGQRKHCSLL